MKIQGNRLCAAVLSSAVLFSVLVAGCSNSAEKENVGLQRETRESRNKVQPPAGEQAAPTGKQVAPTGRQVAPSDKQAAPK